jgi:hypothetical protein
LEISIHIQVNSGIDNLLIFYELWFPSTCLYVMKTLGVNCFLLFALSFNSTAQHLTELDTIFSKPGAKLYIPDQDFDPVDFRDWEVNVPADYYYDAYQGYYILEHRLRKRISELSDQMDEKSREDFINAQKKWDQDRHRICDTLWEEQKMRLGHTKLLEYLYCLNSTAKNRLEAFGDTTPAKEKLENYHGFGRYIIGKDVSAYQQDLLFVKENVELKYKVYTTAEKIQMAGQDGTLRLYVTGNVLTGITIQFKSCGNALSDWVTNLYGRPVRADYNFITEEIYYKWQGKTIELILNCTGGSSFLVFKQKE